MAAAGHGPPALPGLVRGTCSCGRLDRLRCHAREPAWRKTAACTCSRLHLRVTLDLEGTTQSVTVGCIALNTFQCLPGFILACLHIP